MPSVFGYLEIPSINLQQYVVTGTNDESLELGPGHYQILLFLAQVAT